MVPVVFAPLCERLRIGIIGAGAKQPRLLSVPGDALAAQIVQVSPERRVASAMADHARLDDSAARAGRDEPVRLNRGTLAAAEPRAVAGNDRAVAGDRPEIGRASCRERVWQ